MNVLRQLFVQQEKISFVQLILRWSKLIGSYIVEEEQGGEKQAAYGKELLKTISEKLTHEFGRDFGITTLENIRKLYLAYTNNTKKSHALRGKFYVAKNGTLTPNNTQQHTLGHNHKTPVFTA